MRSFFQKLSTSLVALLVFAIPIEHKYDKFLRHFSKTLTPKGVTLPPGFNRQICVFASDFGAIALFLIALFAFRIPLRRLLFENKAPFLWLLFPLALLSILASPLVAYPVIYTRLLQFSPRFSSSLFWPTLHGLKNRPKSPWRLFSPLDFFNRAWPLPSTSSKPPWASASSMKRPM